MYAPQNAYLETSTVGASPLELTVMLYEGAGEAMRHALRHLECGEIAERSRQISRAMDIVLELRNALDYTRGGDLAPRLGAIYDYILSRCLDANLRQDPAPLAEAAGLLEELGQAWQELVRTQQSSAGASFAWQDASQTAAGQFAFSY